MHRTVVAFSAAAAILLAPGAAAVEASLYEGRFFPIGPILAEGSLHLPPSGPMRIQFTTTPDTGRTFNASRLVVVVDEWRWTSISTSSAGEDERSVPTGTAFTRERVELVDATLRVRGLSIHNSWSASIGHGHAVPLLEGLRDCAIAPRPALALTSLLVAECRGGTLNLTVGKHSTTMLAIQGADLVVSGIDPRTGQAEGRLVQARHASERNESSGLYEHRLRRATLQMATDHEVTHVFSLSEARFESPVIQVGGHVRLPAFIGKFKAGSETLTNATDQTALEGTFLLLGSGEFKELGGVQITGTSFLSGDGQVVEIAETDISLTTSLVVVGVSTLLVFACWTWKRLFLGFILFTRMTPPKALLHATRQQIHEFVAANPGVRLHVAAKALGVPRTTFLHHVRILTAQGLIHCEKTGMKVTLWPKDVQASLAATLLQDPTARRVLDTFNEGEARSQKDIATRVGVSQSYVSRMLKRLDAAELLQRDFDGPTGSRFGEGTGA